MAKILKTTFDHISELTPSVRNFFLKISEEENFTFQAGQFMNLYIPNGEGEILVPLSIASSPANNCYVEFCMKRTHGGRISEFFHQISGGETIKLEGPYGCFILEHPELSDLLFAATGTGIAPIRSMIFSLFHKSFKKEVWLFFGVRHENEILYYRDFEELQKLHPNFHFIPVVSKPKNWQGEVGYVQEKLGECIKHPEGKEAYICGLPKMVKEVRTILTDLGLSVDHIHFEQSV